MQEESPPEVPALWSRAGLSVALVLLAGCAASIEGPRLKDVSQALAQRTGAGLQSEGEGEASHPPFDLGDGLSEDEAVGLALWNDADFGSALTQLEVSRAKLHAAGLLVDPALSLLFPWGPKQLEGSLGIPIDFLWNRSRRVKLAELDAERVVQELVVHGLDLVRDVRAECVAWHRAHERAALLALQVETAAQLAGIAQSRVRAGEASPAEELAAETRLAGLRTLQQGEELQVELAYGRLGLRFGDALADQGALAVTLRSGTPTPDSSPTALLELALEARPELRAVELAAERAAEDGGLARSEAWNLVAVIDANAKGTGGFEAGPGLSLTLPVFDGGRGRGSVARAQMALEARRYLGLRRRIAHDVATAHARLLGAAQTQADWRANVLPKAEEEVVVAERAWAAGETSRAPMLEARLRLLDARLADVDLDAARRLAHADLERSVARRLDPSSLLPLDLGGGG